MAKFRLKIMFFVFFSSDKLEPIGLKNEDVNKKWRRGLFPTRGKFPPLENSPWEKKSPLQKSKKTLFRTGWTTVWTTVWTPSPFCRVSNGGVGWSRTVVTGLSILSNQFMSWVELTLFWRELELSWPCPDGCLSWVDLTCFRSLSCHWLVTQIHIDVTNKGAYPIAGGPG